MGKKNKNREKIDQFGYRYKSGDVGDLMRRYGVEGTASYHPSMRGPGSSKKNRDHEDVNRDIAKAMMNDYDTRRTMEAAAMAGNKDAKKFAKKGIKDGKVFEAYDVMKDLKKKYVGGGGMDGAKNRAGLTFAAVKADRDAQTASYDKQYASQDMLNNKINELKDKFKTEKETQAPVEYEESPELKAAKERLSGGEYNTTDSIYKSSTPRPEPTTAFRKENEAAPATDDRKKAVGFYLEQYKKDVIAGGRIGQATTNNLSNAYNTVIRSDI
jgi:hypothetical protein